ncbi:MAG: hypothetical protein VB062_03905 [Christensenella sp.]|nr:hypothetical protein [Christensenella sp.]
MEKNRPTKTEEELTTLAQDHPQTQQPPEELDDLQKKVRAFPDKQWALYQRIGGTVLGLLCGFLLTYFGSFESTGMFGTIGAVIIALFGPNFIEKRVKRTVQKGRFMLMISLGVWLVAYALIMLLSGTPILATPS